MHIQEAFAVLLLFLAVLATPTHQSTTPPEPNHLDSFCLRESGNYTQNSTYHRSLTTVLTDLASNSTFSSSHATSADTVYGRYYCRHDLSLLVCSACVHAATARVAADCPKYREAVIWYEQCTLVYLNSTSRVETIDVASPNFMWYTPENVTDPDQFNPVLEATMNQIINKTAYGSGSEWFATSEANVSAFEKLYSLAQCSPDRGGLLCERCLKKALRHIDLCCSEYNDMAFFYPSCQLRYTILEPFYDVSSSSLPIVAPSSPVVASPEPPPPVNGTLNDSHQPTPPGNGGGIRNHNILIQFGVAVMVLLLGN